MPHRVRILHISDLHERGKREREGWRRRRVLGEAWLENLERIRKEDGPVDLVCFTGDAADWGEEEEFAKATELFNATLDKLNLARDHFFVVPGNHDINRPTEKPAWKRLRGRALEASPLEVSRWMAGADHDRSLGERQRKQLLAGQANYRSWLAGMGRDQLLPDPAVHPNLGYRVSLRLPCQPFDIHLIGLDSAWLCGDDHDSGKLLLTADQIGRCCNGLDGTPLPGLRLVLVHHPLSDLADGAEAQRLLAGSADLLLRGHLHREEISEWADPDRRLRQVAAGCLYEGHGADEYPNACAVIEIEADDAGRPLAYHLRFRSWSARGHWFDDDGLYKGSRGGRLTWRVQPRPTSTRIASRAAEVFVGREKELRELAGHLLAEGEAGPVAICAVEGMPGVGKSYLADRFAAEHAAAFPGGYARLVLDPLAPAGPEVLLGELAERLEIPGSGPGLAERTQERLLRPRTLLHVENVDSDAAARSAARLLRDLSGCAAVVTGRLRDLGRALGWRQVRVETFDEETALRQLREEIGMEPTEPEVPEQRELVRALGYLPLAVHLAAGYLRAGYSARTFIERLKSEGLGIKPFAREELAAAETSEQARKILAASFQISLDLLAVELGPAAERLVFGLRALGHASAAGVGRSLGAAIAGLNEADFEELAVRAGRLNLLIPLPREERSDGAWRVHPLLAELLRRGADSTEVLERTTGWFLDRLPEARPGEEEDQGRRWKEIQVEGAALAVWLSQVPASDLARVERSGTDYARFNGPFRPWAELCERALRQETAPEDRSNFLWTLTLVSAQSGDLTRALAAAQEKVEVDSEAGNHRETALAWGAVANVLQARGQFDEALRIRQEEQIPVFERLGDVRSRAVTLGYISEILQARGQLDEALRIRQEELIPVFERLGDVRSRAVTLGQIADILEVRGQLDEALRIRREEQIPVYERLGDVRSRAVTLGKIADILQDRGQLDEALRIRREEQIPVYERLGDVRERLATWAKLGLGYLQRDQDGDRELAAGLLCRALADAERMRIPEAGQIRGILERHQLQCP